MGRVRDPSASVQDESAKVRGPSAKVQDPGGRRLGGTTNAYVAQKLCSERHVTPSFSGYFPMLVPQESLRFPCACCNLSFYSPDNLCVLDFCAFCLSKPSPTRCPQRPESICADCLAQGLGHWQRFTPSPRIRGRSLLVRTQSPTKIPNGGDTNCIGKMARCIGKGSRSIERYVTPSFSGYVPTLVPQES